MILNIYLKCLRIDQSIHDFYHIFSRMYLLALRINQIHYLKFLKAQH